MKERYGAEHPLQVKDIKEKAKKSTLEKYGTLDMFHIDKVKNTMKERYGAQYAMKNKEIKEKSRIKSQYKKEQKFLQRIKDMDLELLSENTFGYDLRCKKCGKILTNTLREKINIKYIQGKSPCYKCFPDNNTFRSNFENEVYEFIDSIYKDEIQLNRQYLGSEIDILLPNKKIAIECNGTYWHSEFYKEKIYHKNKKILIENKGYQLIQIWEDDWNNPYKKEIIKNRLKIKLGLGKKIYARKCEIKEINGSTAKQFLIENHLKGYTPASINIGLFYNNKLISLSTFKGRKIKNQKFYELSRNCTYKDNIVVGGFSKMINYFVNNYSNNIFSYADCDWSPLKNSSYEKINFKLETYTSPGYYWVINGIRSNRQNFMKHKLVKKGYDKNKTEKEIMHEEGYYRVWDSGNLKFTLNS